jgi:hypothetical protein
VPEVISPLASILEEGLKAIRTCGIEPGSALGSAQETVSAVFGAAKSAVRYGEVNAALDLEGLAVLGAATLAGLRRLEDEAPGVFAIERAVRTLADLIRRTAPAATGW